MTPQFWNIDDWWRINSKLEDFALGTTRLHTRLKYRGRLQRQQESYTCCAALRLPDHGETIFCEGCTNIWRSRDLSTEFDLITEKDWKGHMSQSCSSRTKNEGRVVAVSEGWVLRPFLGSNLSRKPLQLAVLSLSIEDNPTERAASGAVKAGEWESVILSLAPRSRYG